ncbi:hypothetical protein PRK78_002150 [Emydomyces testavorans]|uniref:Uncharacterized protein n=1 Tax=Emydomyces testavorans TaxID=2070801 RepID=A0AAF0DDV3_9EURO|nr:hypothetical protein PRK78_002150 [Emydomyces testavorans]
MGILDAVPFGDRLASLLNTQNAVVLGIAILICVNLKDLPGFWHVHTSIFIFKGLATQLLLAKPHRSLVDIRASNRNKTKQGGTPRLFSYLVTTHRNPPIECDYNLHKSNSTFFSDLDINRAQLLIALFNGMPRWSATPGGEEKSLRVALGGTSCVFKREIKPLQQYEVWSRVLTWDETWLYIWSYFVKKGTGRAVTKALEERQRGCGGFDVGKAILASADGRRTVRPEGVLVMMGLHPDEDMSDKVEGKGEDAGADDGRETEKKVWDWAMFKAQKERGLEAAMLFQGSDALPLHFEETASSVLGTYSDM